VDLDSGDAGTAAGVNDMSAAAEHGRTDNREGGEDREDREEIGMAWNQKLLRDRRDRRCLRDGAVSVSSGSRSFRVICLLAILAGAPGCLVLSLNPVYDDTTIAWEPALIGHWVDAEDKASLEIERGEWRSYRVRYEHPIETGELTGYLTIIGNDKYLDLMPVRGQDRGSFIIPVHAFLRMKLDGDRLELAPPSYDWFFDRLRAGTPIEGLAATLDQKENALITSPVGAIRTWLRLQPADGPMVGAAATFTRKPQ
jgi:hypothetical protein